MPLNHNVRCHVCHTQVAGVKDNHIIVVSRNEVIIVTVLQLQCDSHNHSCSVAVIIAMSWLRSKLQGHKE